MITMKNSIFVTAALLVAGVVGAQAGGAPPAVEDCAKTMCRDMRTCGGFGETVDQKKTSAPTWKRSNVSAKKSESAQGIELSCYGFAYADYVGCTGLVVSPDQKRTDGTDATPVKAADTPSAK